MYASHTSIINRIIVLHKMTGYWSSNTIDVRRWITSNVFGILQGIISVNKWMEY